MKKTYVVPESKLYAINISENIAGSDVLDSGDDMISTNAVITFTYGSDPCRGYYTNDTTAPVTVTGDAFAPYYNELREYGKKNLLVYFNCFEYAG